jgi:DNA gyrase inhibitor GyrI
MEKLDIRMVTLPQMRVASALGFGTEPEMQAWNKLMAWAQAKNLLNTTPAPQFFGFNNPNPTPGSPNYGYEVWMTVSADVNSDDTVQVKDVPGGFYAVTRVKGVDNIFNTWQKLVAWAEQSPYQPVEAQCLERHVNVGADVPPEALVLDLYLPVKGS